MSHFPVSHPEYLYPESRNPYRDGLRKITGAGTRPGVYADNDAEGFRGNWRDRFPIDSFPKIRRAPGIAAGEVISQPGLTAHVPGSPNHGQEQRQQGPQQERQTDQTSCRRELHVEIGCNAGHVTLEWAARHAENAYVGVDWKHKAIFRAAEKASKRELANAIFVRGNAERLPYLFGPGEIDRLSVFFPDPWPKKSQWRNRTLTSTRLREFAAVVRPGGKLHIKTDHEGYFDWIVEAAAGASDVWRTVELTRDLHRGNPNLHKLEVPDVTLFEKLFIKDGIAIKSIWLERV